LVRPLLKEANQAGVRILLVPVRANTYQQTTLKDYQSVLDPERPLAEMTQAELDRALDRISEEIVDSEAPRFRGTLPKAAVSNLPERSPVFTGQERALTLLQEALTEEGPAVLSGVSGVGKTLTAIEYAYRHLGDYARSWTGDWIGRPPGEGESWIWLGDLGRRGRKCFSFSCSSGESSKKCSLIHRSFSLSSEAAIRLKSLVRRSVRYASLMRKSSEIRPARSGSSFSGCYAPGGQP
jgi:hypothetical protein